MEGQRGSTDEVTFWGVTGQRLGAYQLGVSGSTLTATQSYTNYYFGSKLLKNTSGFVYADRLGSAVNTYPYGQEFPSATANGKEKFATYFRDAETGNDYAVNRYEQPGMGRFLTPDPAGAGLNWYSYVGGDPINFVDPAGLDGVSDVCGDPTIRADYAWVWQAACEQTGMGNMSSLLGAAVGGGLPLSGSSLNGAVGWTASGMGLLSGTSATLSGSGVTVTGVSSTINFTDPSVSVPVPPAVKVYVDPPTPIFLPLPGSTGAIGGSSGNIISANPTAPQAGTGTQDPYPTRLFGTHWCGKGGAGPPVNSLDVACMHHDFCYDRYGLSAGSNYDPARSSDRDLQECNQRLCDAAKGQGASGGLVRLYFGLVPAGACRPRPGTLQ